MAKTKKVPSKENEKENIDEKETNLFFQINSAQHSLTNIHFIFHSFLITAISVLYSSSRKNEKALWLIFALSIIGILSAIVSYRMLKRADGFSLAWQKALKIDKKISKIEGEITKQSNTKKGNTRKMLLGLITSIYVVFAFFSKACTKLV